MTTRQDVVIIGAPRSGTNLLREILIQLPSAGSWPCDEINYIWRHGNLHYPSDALPPELASPKVVSYIRRQFDMVAVSQDLRYVVEKTCANSLRVPFVNRVLPNASYLFLVRDGFDAVASAMHRWKANIDWSYITKKTRYVPMTDMPYYALRYLGHRFYRLFSREKRLSTWGPQVPQMNELSTKHDLAEICAIQWKSCVCEADRALSRMPENKVLKLKYESLVVQPMYELERICNFLSIPIFSRQIKLICADVSRQSIGKGHAQLGEEGIARLIPIIKDTRARFGYE